jgi:hypothetical protein
VVRGNFALLAVHISFYCWQSVQKDRDAAINSLEKAEYAVEALKAEITVRGGSYAFIH